MEKISVVIAGPRGKMGREAVRLVEQSEHLTLAGVIDRKYDQQLLSELDGFSSDVKIYTDPAVCFDETIPDVLVDLTTPETGYLHARTALQHGVRPVIGTTGFTKDELDELKELSKEKKLGTIIAPNFAVGAILMMKFSQMAAKYFSDIEIIEMHHDQKLDAPSGTALKTAEMIREQRSSKQQGHPDEKETVPGARGAEIDGMRVHSVRLPGLVAHQQVMFGGEGQLLTIRHDSHDRKSFMSGVKLCIETVMNLEELVYGVENILD
ncbi:4-hydroxy-tetrahydrodipicolinate reductase [Jeotgalibacillus sp. R-1-5s-1]|uniref:4-hydroxy-tetrahydrodipicolinate reductase n=1 Tax=Jeotgalibacillus sp. R-1-5s-1 TaxID=2555897 RepID=UPI00106CC4DB|nr:4-hydroxy-tetrahydrodipicolinate reductase [Jeotgalibacillus sp. R-1-5s-1]TFE03228.1 4-hydroxy-tetrahydrodipicolinate reductase [Jeotgalibacillus sp. R-1-5s-1]